MALNETKRPRFSLGQVVATPGALEEIRDAGQSTADFLARHAACDWGDLDEEDRCLNDEALIDGSRLLSAYTTKGGVKLWIITEAVGDDSKRPCTTILKPEEY
jgi:hypothetical protein